MDAQRTLRRQISCVGIGLHSGNKVNLTLKPAPADFGIRFRRTDLGDLEVPATVPTLPGIQLATGLARNEVSVETVEHLSRRFVSLGVDNVIVELNSPEVPIMDVQRGAVHLPDSGSGHQEAAGRPEYLKIVRPIMLCAATSALRSYPSNTFKVTYSISYDHPLLRHRRGTLRITEESFVEELAPARTFTFLKDVEMLRQNGWRSAARSKTRSSSARPASSTTRCDSKTSSSATRFSTRLAIWRWSAIGHRPSVRASRRPRPPRSSRRRFSRKRTRGVLSRAPSPRRRRRPLASGARYRGSPTDNRLNAPASPTDGRLSVQDSAVPASHGIPDLTC